MGGFTNPSVSDFQNYFVRDFTYGTDPTTVNPIDITNAMMDAASQINQGLFGAQEQYTVGFLNLSAHYLVTSLQSSSQGVSGAWTWQTQSKGVGNVNQSYAIPQRILDNPMFSYLSKTNYGMKYLSLILPQLSGVMFTVHGTTKP
jgi:hypothetical protein